MDLGLLKDETILIADIKKGLVAFNAATEVPGGTTTKGWAGSSSLR